MSLLPITLYGDKILRKKVSAVLNVDVETVALIKNMFETMRNANGVGLAANQVGVNKSIFIVDLSEVEEFENFKPMVVINPEITWYSEEKIKIEEGCLSIPEVRAEVLRPEKIRIRFNDSDMNEKELFADGLLARVMQHEYDHLRGILFTDLIDKSEKDKFKNTLVRIKNRKAKFDYPVSDKTDYQMVL